ncbi:hypothetical protein [Rivibacter subsaxonicus]|nr:hypothetical protein [Rivibacter subsaxonicus]
MIANLRRRGDWRLWTELWKCWGRAGNIAAAMKKTGICRSS